MVGIEIESIVVPEGGIYAEMALAPGQVIGNNVFWVHGQQQNQ